MRDLIAQYWHWDLSRLFDRAVVLGGILLLAYYLYLERHKFDWVAMLCLLLTFFCCFLISRLY